MEIKLQLLDREMAILQVRKEIKHIFANLIVIKSIIKNLNLQKIKLNIVKKIL